jgi:anthranilate phosphoribosyltransferase
LCHNDLGADELIGFANNVIHRAEGDLDLLAGADIPARGSLADLGPSAGDPVGHFLDVLTGRASPAAVDAVCLNAAALMVLGGLHEDWTAASRAAAETIRNGAAIDLVNRMRSTRATNLLAVGHG